MGVPHTINKSRRASQEARSAITPESTLRTLGPNAMIPNHEVHRSTTLTTMAECLSGHGHHEAMKSASTRAPLTFDPEQILPGVNNHRGLSKAAKICCNVGCIIPILILLTNPTVSNHTISGTALTSPTTSAATWSMIVRRHDCLLTLHDAPRPLQAPRAAWLPGRRRSRSVRRRRRKRGCPRTASHPRPARPQQHMAFFLGHAAEKDCWRRVNK